MSRRIAILCVLGVCLVLLGSLSRGPFSDSADAWQAVEQADGAVPEFVAMIDQYCTDCHNPLDKKGGFDLEGILGADLASQAAVWEKVLQKIDGRQMPPANWRRPTEQGYRAMSSHLTSLLDQAARDRPNPGRTDTYRHLSRTEYQNAIRDLLSLDIDAAALLPPDESSHGFDHITVGDLTPVLLSRYVQAAQKISRQAIGSAINSPQGTTYRIPADLTQEYHVQGLPLGTRGGALWKHTFPRDGEYEVQVRLMRDRDEFVEGLNGTHHLEVLVDRAVAASFEVAKPKEPVPNHFDDAKLNARIKVTAGPHDVGVTFVDNGNPLEETRRQPLNAHFNAHRHPRLSPAVYQVSITGPFAVEEGVDQATQSPSRRRIFVTYPQDRSQERSAAREIIASLARRAYRRTIDEADLEKPMGFFDAYHEKEGFEAGIEMALSAILTSPHFLLKIEADPAHAKPGEAYRLSQFELASRLSFFIWSSIPDEELLEQAELGNLAKPDVLEAQVRRMLADEKAQSLATNFASQWLHLRNLDSRTPDARLYPDFDENLRRAMRRETEMNFMEIIREDHSVLSLIRSDHTYLDERLARHYGIPHVYGSRFRRVDLAEDSPRGGLLGQGSVLTVTSYATRTSPVVRGDWVLKTLLGTTVPPPPKDVPSLDSVIDPGLTVRERLSIHREDAACASCHNLMDPIGFSLEHFDAVGRWRERDAGQAVDASGELPDGSKFVGVSGLEAGILANPDRFVTAMTQKIMTFALGRGVAYYDGPAVRRIVSQAGERDYRFSQIVLGIVKSEPFQMRRAQ